MQLRSMVLASVVCLGLVACAALPEEVDKPEKEEAYYPMGSNIARRGQTGPKLTPEEAAALRDKITASTGTPQKQ
ncbi:hypothetical protein [Chitinimonas sp.]|uniref:hypothetical protein n=1 Tax=Chitinimonas sp. TaxID=1934313 RepID=UPI002F936E4D